MRTPDIRREVHDVLPRAVLLAPTTDERTLAALAGESDLVIAVDPADEFDRLALTAAASGAAVVVRADGPAAWVLDGLALTFDSSLPASILPDGWDSSPSARQARVTAVMAACGPEVAAAALRDLLSERALPQAA